MTHSDIFNRVIYFVKHLLDDELLRIPDVIGEFFDTMTLSVEFVTSQISPSTSTIDGSLSDHEYFYGIKTTTAYSVDVRRQKILAAKGSNGDLRQPYFELIAQGLGYSIGKSTSSKWLTITDAAFKPFRAGISRAGIDAVYSQSFGTSQYSVVVRGVNVEADMVLQAMFEKQVLAGIDFKYIDS